MENGQLIERSWKEFDLSPPAPRSGVYASINHKGRIVFNRELWEELDEPKAVSLLYDEHSQCIGIRKVSPLMPSAFPVADYTGSRTFTIQAKDFIAAAKLDISYCIRFTDPHFEIDVLVLDLNHTTRVLGSRRRRA